MHVISECENVAEEGKNYGIFLFELQHEKHEFLVYFSWIWDDTDSLDLAPSGKHFMDVIRFSLVQLGPPPFILYCLLQALRAPRIMLYECCVSLAGVSFCKIWAEKGCQYAWFWPPSKIACILSKYTKLLALSPVRSKVFQLSGVVFCPLLPIWHSTTQSPFPRILNLEGGISPRQFCSTESALGSGFHTAPLD